MQKVAIVTKKTVAFSDILWYNLSLYYINAHICVENLMDKRTTKTTHYSLVALICVLIVTFALGMGGVAAAGQNSTNSDVVSGFTKVGNFDMETLRRQYFSQTAVQ